MIVYKLRKDRFFRENIDNWEKNQMSEEESNEPLYESKYNSYVKEFYEKEKSAIPKTMGYSQTPLRPPGNYLKKHSGEKKLETEAKSVPCLCRALKPYAPFENIRKIESTPSVPRCSQRNFVVENSLLARKIPPAVPKTRLVDDRRGNVFPLDSSGWVPRYTYKENYGQKPQYIEIIEKNLEESRKAFKNFLAAESLRTKPWKMSEETKKEIFEGVVRNWKELLRRYLMIPLKCETLEQRKRKLEIEKRIDALERDIDLLIRHKDIFIGENVPYRS